MKVNTLPEKKQNQRLAVLRNTVAKGSTDAEFSMFLEFCKATKLNPFKREIWFVKGRDYTNKRGEKVEGSVQIMTGFNGYLAIANAHPKYDGMECEIVKNDDGSIDYAEAKVYRKDRKFPSVARVFMKEFYKPGFSGKESNWDKMPAVMIQKVAKSHALREAFPQELGGLYTQEEMGEESPKMSFEQVNQLNAVKEQEIKEEDVDQTIESDSYEEANLKAEKEYNKKEINI